MKWEVKLYVGGNVKVFTEEVYVGLTLTSKVVHIVTQEWSERDETVKMSSVWKLIRFMNKS